VTGITIGSQIARVWATTPCASKVWGPLWVKTGKSQNEHKFSGLPPIADLATREEAARNIDDAIVQWIDEARTLGQEIPQPKADAAIT
jgi:hypothetical protein